MVQVMEIDEEPSKPDEFVLSTVLMGHSGDVKAVATTSQGTLLSGGRDETVKMWIRRGGDYSEQLTLQQMPKGGAIVYSIAFYEDEDGWKLFVGRKDGIIAVYGSGCGATPLVTVQQHTNVVSCLYADARNGKLISGSWDNHVIIWPINEFVPENSGFSALLCEGHTLSVWAVASIEDKTDLVLSASADRSIRLWEKDRLVKQFIGHKDVVRALLVLKAGRFLSASNDFTIRLWSLELASSLAVFRAPHEEFIYSMSRVGENHVVSCTDCGYLCVWALDEDAIADESCLTQKQVMATPVGALWSVVGLPNGDFAAAASNGRVFVMTQDPKRIAPAAVRESLDAELAARIAAAVEKHRQMEDESVTIKVALDDGAPNMELKYVKGTDPGLAAEKFITDHQLPISYLNEITDYIKQNIPEARDFRGKRVGGGGGGEQHSVEVLAEDGRSLVCSFSGSDDPDGVAQDFVEKNHLPIKYLASTAAMVRREQSAGRKKEEAHFYDPFTGGGRYVPSGAPSGTSALDADPLTGSGRYVPGEAKSPGATTGSGDPFTSSGRYIPGTSSVVPNASRPVDKIRPRGDLCPLSQYFVFGRETFSQKAFTRLMDDNEKSEEAFRLSPDQLELLKVLATDGAETIEDIDALIGALNTGLNWRMEELLPIFDLFRIGLTAESVNRYYSVGSGSVDLRARLLALLVSDSPENLKVVVCRSICNMFCFESGRQLVRGEMLNLLPVIASLLLNSKQHLQAAAASAIANWAFLLMRSGDKVQELGPKEDCLREIVKRLEGQVSFGTIQETALTRVVQAIATLMWGDVTVIKLAKSRNVGTMVTRMKDALPSEEGKSLCRDVVEMIFAV